MKLLIALAAAVLAASTPAFAQAPAAPKAQERVVLPKTVTPVRYDIRVAPDAAKLSFTGQAPIAVQVNQATDRMVLNAADLTIRSASLSGRTEAPRIVLGKADETAAFVFSRP